MGNHHIRAKSEVVDVYRQKTFVFDLEPVAATTSVNFVCDNAKTDFSFGAISFSKRRAQLNGLKL
jgi:hypothetical protein